MTATPAERIRTLLLRGDNLLKGQGATGDAAARAARARKAYEEAREVARDPGVEPRLRELIERRLAELDAEPGDGDGG